MTHSSISRRAFVAASAGTLLPAAALAQDAWPSRPVRIVVPWAPGGGVDIVARHVAQKLSERLGQPFTVDNKPGGAGTIGMGDVARANPDGYTLLAVDTTYAFLPFTIKKLPWPDHDKAFRHVTITALSPGVIVVGAKSPYKDLASLLKAARDNPGKITYGTGGAGSQPHFVAAGIERAANVRMMMVPYRGVAPAVADLIGGRIDCVATSTPSIIASATQGLTRALAVCGDKRSPSLPDVPTFSEAGLPQFNVFTWSGISAPAGTPDAVMEKLHGAIAAILKTPETLKFMIANGAEPGGMTPQQFQTRVSQETERWKAVAQYADIQPE